MEKFNKIVAEVKRRGIPLTVSEKYPDESWIPSGYIFLSPGSKVWLIYCDPFVVPEDPTDVVADALQRIVEAKKRVGRPSHLCVHYTGDFKADGVIDECMTIWFQ